MTAVGIHDHTEFKLGRAKPIYDRPKLHMKNFIRQIPDHPVTADDLTGIRFGMDGNDRYGVCVPTGYDNFRRLVTGLLEKKQEDASQDQIFDWYKTQNPQFNPGTDADDNGMVIQLFLEYLVKEGQIAGFAAVDSSNIEELKAAAYIFLGLVVGVNLEVAQQAQTGRGVWDYVSNTDEWGGHCVMTGAYGNEGLYCVSWAQKILMTVNFIAEQLEEAWVVLLPEHISHPDFRQYFDLQKFAVAYTEITGRPFPVDVPPQPAPVPPAPTPEPGALNLVVTDETLVNHIHHAAALNHRGDVNAWHEHLLKMHFRMK
jgi:hypothetical protein